MRCTNSRHWVQPERGEYLVCPECGNDTLHYEPERSGEDAYMSCICGWSESSELSMSQHGVDTRAYMGA